MLKKQLWICSITGALAVIFGALGAHRLQPLLSNAELSTWETAVQYHFIHALALLVIATGNRNYKFLNWSFTFFALGILFFSGSLYFLSVKSHLGIEQTGLLGALTPVGGLFFIIGWIMIIFHRTGK
ncbi:uncharacterized membrane protein YgdD (TMEM256/DUF423 family) [Anseongella ginsenosidimutans]|uniref:Uncharacterized membrane protein YgdD (TMEM256/DUF423 family) n=1 Tax=Anseongella ginsenosidimutans TaxID=496056 RepID=A0A4R3KSV0_9SPHI|nr:DUF423 domain-containing protein [Anseongella ginsenosidimutans]TCS88306.1 uncharacterized membrane protein YgdD (TMEM256/DUF423 family) [Anseongella ginsenosidimutans]